MFSLGYARLVPLVLLSALLPGCGGGGYAATPIPAGRYVGTWTSEYPGDETGTADLTIAADRTLSGTMDADYGVHYGPGGKAAGEVASGGKAKIAGDWEVAGFDAPWSLSYHGTLRYDPASGTLKGTLLRYRGDGYSRHLWTLTRQP